MHSGLRSAAANGPTTPPRGPFEISAAASRWAAVIASGGIAGILSTELLTRSVSHERFASLRERELQALARQAGDERADDPAETVGDAARQRHRFAFEVDAAVALLEAPVRVEAPQVAVPLANGLLALPAGARVRHLGQTRAANPAPRTAGAQPGEARVVLAVHDHRDHLCHHEA